MNNVILIKDWDHQKLGFIPAGTPLQVDNETLKELQQSKHVKPPAVVPVKDEEE